MKEKVSVRFILIASPGGGPVLFEFAEAPWPHGLAYNDTTLGIEKPGPNGTLPALARAAA